MNNGINENDDIQGTKHFLNSENINLNNKKFKFNNEIIEENDIEHLENYTLKLLDKKNLFENRKNKRNDNKVNIKNINCNKNSIDNVDSKINNTNCIDIDNNNNNNINNNSNIFNSNNKKFKNNFNQYDKFFRILDPVIFNIYKNRISVLTDIRLDLIRKLKKYSETFLNQNEECPSLFIPHTERNFELLYGLCQRHIINNNRKPYELTDFIGLYKKPIKLPNQLKIAHLCIKYAYSQYLDYVSMLHNISNLYDLYLGYDNIPEEIIESFLIRNSFEEILPINQNFYLETLKHYYIRYLEDQYKIDEFKIQQILDLLVILRSTTYKISSEIQDVIIIDDEDNNKNKNTNNYISKNTYNEMDMDEEYNKDNQNKIKEDKTVIYIVDDKNDELNNEISDMNNYISNEIKRNRDINEIDGKFECNEIKNDKAKINLIDDINNDINNNNNNNNNNNSNSNNNNNSNNNSN
eukprot:jgi/Orpsp1_1/1187125/evm.model.d7180000055578.1